MDSMGVIGYQANEGTQAVAMEIQMAQKNMKYNHDSHKKMKGDDKA